MSLCQHTLKIPAIWLNPVHCRGKTNTYGSVFWKRQGEVIADSNVLASVQSQCMWERSETKKTSQISFYFGCKILEGGCLDPPLAHQQPWDVCISIMGYFILFFFFLWEILQSWMGAMHPAPLLPTPQAASLSSDSVPSVSTVVLKRAEQSCWRADAFWA